MCVSCMHSELLSRFDNLPLGADVLNTDLLIYSGMCPNKDVPFKFIKCSTVFIMYSQTAELLQHFDA